MIASGYGTIGKRAVEWPEVIGRCWDSFCILTLFIAGFVLIFYLWRLVLGAAGNASTSRMKGLLNLLGCITEEGSSDGQSRWRLRATGLLGTLVILGFCVAGSFAISSQRVEYHAGDSAADRSGEPTFSWGDLPPYLQNGESQTANGGQRSVLK